MTTVFGIAVCVTSAAWSVSQERCNHVVHVFYQLMDNDADGNVDLQTLLAERREPLGYTNSGRLLVHHQDLIFMVVAAVFMQCNLVILDSATAMPHHVIVRCQRPNSRRQRSAHAQLRSDEGMVPWVRICQLVKGALGRKVLSLKTAPGRELSLIHI